VHAVLTALVAGEPAILVGEPGTAKTALVERLAQLINGRYFYYLLSRFTEPDELLGPLDIGALRAGQYKRITVGRLPDAHLAFLDEIFKASTAIRNTLLDIILYKRFLNGTGYQAIPLLALYTASNEVSYDAEDAAFYDRLTIRQFVKPVEETEWADLLIRGVELTAVGENSTPITDVDYVRVLQEEVRRRARLIINDEGFRNKILSVLSCLKNKGVTLSDRRKVKFVFVIAAASIVASEVTPSPASIMDAVWLVAMRNEDDEEKVSDVLREVFGDSADVPNTLMALEAEVRNATENLKKTRSIDDLKTLRKLLSTVQQKLKDIPPRARYYRYYRSLQAAVSEATRLIKEVEGE
jgi:MoxR-like ATPase